MLIVLRIILILYLVIGVTCVTFGNKALVTTMNNTLDPDLSMGVRFFIGCIAMLIALFLWPLFIKVRIEKDEEGK